MKYKYIDEEKQHLHTLDGKPLLGTSTVVGIIAKPLTWWASGLACGVLGWLNPKNNAPEAVKTRAGDALNAIKTLDTDSYIELLQKAYKAHSEKLDLSAESGTDMHAELERYVKNTMANRMDTYSDKIMPFITWANKNVKQFLWSEGHCYSEKLWCGGISDCGAVLNDDSIAIIDFKSGKEAYTSQFIQCAGYGLQIMENGVVDSEGKNVIKLLEPKFGAYIVVPFGAKDPTPVVMRNTGELEEAFVHACELYKFINKTDK